VPIDEAHFWFIGRPEEEDRATMPVFGLVDEASKLNLNTATQEMLEGLPGMTAELAAAIIDWRDEDDEVTSGGAESETYLLRQPSYACKNGPFESVEELALVHGATWALLYGEDANRNGVLDPNENDGNQTAPDDNSDGRVDRGLVDYVTVHSREPNRRSDGSARINVSGVTQELTDLLRETFGEQRAAEIQSRLGGGGGNVRSLLEFFLRGAMTTDEFDQIAGEITVDDEEFREGLVNVNTASATVLACLPGIDEAKASELVATRLSRAAPASSVAWVGDVLGEESAILAGPYLTAQSWQAMADVAAVGRHGRGYRRTMFIIDYSGGTPRIAYRQNLASSGWALGQNVDQALALDRRGR
jgi:DNA uptake protein ComE-like DNA-binding protein